MHTLQHAPACQSLTVLCACLLGTLLGKYSTESSQSFSAYKLCRNLVTVAASNCESRRCKAPLVTIARRLQAP